jgi:hypothetical protein
MDEYFNTNDAKKLLAGKESGHIMGTIVEEMCGDILSEEGLEITQELDNKGNPLPRAHSDFLIKSKDGAKNRNNVKFLTQILNYLQSQIGSAKTTTTASNSNIRLIRIV